MFARTGETTAPCGVPCRSSFHSVPSMTPAFSHLVISRNPPEPYYTYIKEGDRAQLAAATDAASSSAKWQLWCFFGGVAFYVIWILENLLT